MEQKWTTLQKELLLKSQVGAQNMLNLRVINKNQQWGKTVKLSVLILAVCKNSDYLPAVNGRDRRFKMANSTNP